MGYNIKWIEKCDGEIFTYLNLLIAKCEPSSWRKKANNSTRQYQNARTHCPIQSSNTWGSIFTCITTFSASQTFKLIHIIVKRHLALDISLIIFFLYFSAILTCIFFFPRWISMHSFHYFDDCSIVITLKMVYLPKGRKKLNGISTILGLTQFKN